MTGNELRRKLVGNGVGLVELAGKLGLSQQAFSNRLTVKSVKPEFVRQIEEVVGFSLTEQPVSTDSQKNIDSLIGLLQKKDEQMDRLITLLEQKYGVVEKEKRNVG
jgi:hypothetical protein